MNIVVCGNPTLDELVQEERVRISPGGSALFASGAADYLGAKVGIMGNIGEDYPSNVLSWLKDRGLNLNLLKNTKGPSTRFRIGYRHGSRRLWVLHAGRSVESTWKGSRVEGLHLGPVFNEISESLVGSLRNKCRFMSLDIQGLVRKVSRSGEVHVFRRNLDSVSRMCDLIKASIDEAKLQTPSRDHRVILDRFLAKGPKYAILTLGARGSLLGIRNYKKFLIPAFPDKTIKDPTGAGDVYAGAWLTSYLRTNDPVWAASVGSALGSLASQRTGLSKFRISRRELFRRTSWVYTHVSQL
ncbi:MAG TPA: PfkB family carbohydrate kinase [Candidatus Angelobacter sp.]|nr:PfkB family carbohydrate kinase [Candidatus Angelobacter sp.]